MKTVQGVVSWDDHIVVWNTIFVVIACVSKQTNILWFVAIRTGEVCIADGITNSHNINVTHTKIIVNFR